MNLSRKYFTFPDYAAPIGFALVLSALVLALLGELFANVGMYFVLDVVKAGPFRTFLTQYINDAFARTGLYRIQGFIELGLGTLGLPFSIIGLDSIYRKPLAVNGIVFFCILLFFLWISVF